MPSLWLVLVLLATTPILAPGCGDDDDDDAADGDADADADPDAGHEPVAFGEPCETDDDCVEGACFEQACTRPCIEYSQCPGGTICGAADEDRILCVSYSYDEANVGVNCTNNDDACHGGTTCRSRGRDDPLAFCANGCESDRDCPPQWFCSTGFADEEEPYCQKRQFCDHCNVDDDCRYGEDDCIVGSDGLSFCSFVCDPDPGSSSCPTDSECREVQGHGFQCVPLEGGCTGDGSGELCQPCRFDSDCSEGPCLYDRYAQIRFCGKDCTDDPCPESFDCRSVDGEPRPQCYPRKPSCSRPSGGGHTCDPCADYTDCASGSCIIFNTSSYCGNDCSVQPCDAWSECQDFADGQLHLCVPLGDLTCGEYYQCTLDCDPKLDDCVGGDCR